MAASAQAVLEETLLHSGRHLKAVTNEDHLCLAGGVAYNCVANSRLLRDAGFDEVFVTARGWRLWSGARCGPVADAPPRRSVGSDDHANRRLGDRDSPKPRAWMHWSSQVGCRPLDAMRRSVKRFLESSPPGGWCSGFRPDGVGLRLGNRSLLADRVARHGL